MLSPYRVLDLTDEKGHLCGKLLGDLGADVIKIERPGGDPARSIGPFYHDEPDPEKSLFWFAFNTSKRGITLSIETTDGQELFRKLVKTADFVIESFPPGYMDRLGLGYSALEKINPRIIMVSITPFGQTGPYKDYKAPDIVAWAMGGSMRLLGDADRPPIRISHHSHAYLHAATEAAVGALMALHCRELTGKGQQVDVSIQASVAQLLQAICLWDMLKAIPHREQEGLYEIRQNWTRPCKDGYVVWSNWGGTQANRWVPPLINWMDSEGMADDFLKGFDWEAFDPATAPRELLDRLDKPMNAFFMAHTKDEVLEAAVKHHIMLFPVNTPADVLESTQLAAREFWAEIEHPELGTTIPYPGAFGKFSESSPRMLRRAPLIGEHNQEIYEKELGLSREELLRLKQAQVI